MAADREAPSGDAQAERYGSTIEPGELYVVVRKAVEDAILGVIGTLLLVGVALVLVWFGIALAASSFGSSPPGLVGGILVVLVGFYVAASALDVVPSVSDLMSDLV